MAKSIYQFWLNNGKSKIRLPVIPESIMVSSNITNDSVRVSDFGEITFIQKPGGETYQFSALLPGDWFPSCEYRNIPNPREIEKKIKKWVNDKDTCQFIVTGPAKLNVKVSIESVDFSEGSYGVNDLVMAIRLKEYVVPKPRTIKIKRTAKKPVKKVSKPRPKPKVVNKTYTVKRGDTLWAIAIRYYGSGLKWKKIWNEPSNKKMLIARDKRNIRQPGHWIYLSQKLVIKR